MPFDPWYTTQAVSAKLMILSISARFREFEPTIFGHGWISMPCDAWYTTLEASAKFVISAIFGRFRGL